MSYLNLSDPSKFAAAWNQVEDPRTDDANEIRETFKRDQEEADEKEAIDGQV